MNYCAFQALEADKAPELLHYLLSAGLNSAAAGSESEARRRLVEALEATVPRDKVSTLMPSDQGRRKGSQLSIILSSSSSCIDFWKITLTGLELYILYSTS